MPPLTTETVVRSNPPPAAPQPAPPLVLMGDVWPSDIPFPKARDPAPGTIWLACRNRTDEVEEDSERQAAATCLEFAQLSYMTLQTGLTFPLQQPCVHIEYLVIIPCTMCTCPSSSGRHPNCRNHRCCTVPVDHPHLRPEEATERPRVHFVSVVTATSCGSMIQADPGHVQHTLFRYHAVTANAWELARLMFYATSCGFGPYRTFTSASFVFSVVTESELRWQIAAESIVRPWTDVCQFRRFEALNERYKLTLAHARGEDSEKPLEGSSYSAERCLTATLMEELARELISAGTGMCQAYPTAESALEDKNRISWLRAIVSHCAGIHKVLARECRNKDGSISRIARRRELREGRLLTEKQPASFICVESVMNAFLFAGLLVIAPGFNPASTAPPLAVLALLESGRVSNEDTTNLMCAIKGWDQTLDIPLRTPHGKDEQIFESA